jgi:hypothetical protein
MILHLPELRTIAIESGKRLANRMLLKPANHSNFCGLFFHVPQSAAEDPHHPVPVSSAT